MATKKVRATLIGYYGDEIRNEGDEFEIPADEALGSWMELVDPPAKAAPKGRGKGKPKPKPDDEDDEDDEDDANPFE